MIEKNLYKIETSGRYFYVIADSFSEAEEHAMKVIEEYDIHGYTRDTIYRIELNGKVYRPKTKTITIDV